MFGWAVYSQPPAGAFKVSRPGGPEILVWGNVGALIMGIGGSTSIVLQDFWSLEALLLRILQAAVVYLKVGFHACNKNTNNLQRSNRNEARHPLPRTQNPKNPKS